MMAAGLPVVDLYRENNLYDIPDTGVLLADSTPEAIATALIRVLDDDKLQKQMSTKGNQYMQDYPLERGFHDFLEAVQSVLDDKKIASKKVSKTYLKDPVMPSQEVLDVSYLIQPIPVPVKPTGKKMRYLVRCKKALMRRLGR